MSRPPTEEEFTAWLSHPVTQSVKDLLGKKREELRQLWEAGSFTDYDQSGTVLVNVGNMGTCKGFAYVMDLDYEILLTELDDGKQVGVEAPRGRSVDQVV